MPVLEYSGKFGVNGQVVCETTVRWTCPTCGKESSTRHGSYKLHKDMCACCQRFGEPLSEAAARGKYQQIQTVKTLDKRGAVGYDSIVDVVCQTCGCVFETTFRHVKTGKPGWRCRSCGKIKDGQEILLPDALPGYIKRVNIETLGSLGRVLTTTDVFLDCPRCGIEQQRPWSNVKRLGQALCKACASAVRWENDEYRQAYSKMLSAKWKTEEYRKNVLGNRKDNGYFSGLHRDVKQALLAYGITGLQTEQLIGDYRVDEVDFDRMVALEIQGDYWHFNPAIYPPDYKCHRDGKITCAKDKWDEDAKRAFVLRMTGYRVYTIWEKEFYDNPPETIANFYDWLMSIEVSTVDALSTKEK